MKLYLKDDDGKTYEIEEAKELQQGDVVVFLNLCMHPKDIKRIEKNLSRRLGRKVVVLDEKFRDIVVLPPVPETVDEYFQTESRRLI